MGARGIDIAGLPFVIQTTLPDDIENYIHRIGRCGRAERMGLAISIVATEREKVWYHKCPSRGKNCTPWPGNTKLTIPFGPNQKLLPRDDSKWIVDEGGCSIWYDEPELIKQIEKRIGQPMLVMDPEDFGVPGVIESPLGPEFKKKVAVAVVKEPPSRRALKRKTEEKQLVVYGAKKGDATLAASAKHTEALAPVVSELAALEKEIQQIFASSMWGSYDSPKPKPKVASRSVTAPSPAPQQSSSLNSTLTPAATEDAPKPATGWATGGKAKAERKKARW